MIRVKNIKKSFNEKPVLKGISCEFEKGKTSLIIGQTGSGKTVFMKCLLGLHKHDSGKIIFNDRDFEKMNENQKMEVKSRIGTVFQGSALFDSMTIEENVMFPLRMFKNMPYDEMLDRVNLVLKRVELENSNKKMPSEASGGMQKRVAIARAIVNNPSYLFCDEPNSGLDPKTAIVIDNLIKEITEELNITTIINSHDMNSVMEIGEKIMFIHKGKKIWEGNNKNIFNNKIKELDEFIFSNKLMKKIKP